MLKAFVHELIQLNEELIREWPQRSVDEWASEAASYDRIFEAVNKQVDRWYSRHASGTGWSKVLVLLTACCKSLTDGKEALTYARGLNGGPPNIVDESSSDTARIRVTSMTTAHPCLLPFYCNVSNFAEQSASGGGDWIECGHPIPSTGLSRFLVRESYAAIADQIGEGPRDAWRPPTKAIITGSPGIGKSLFLMYLLHKLVKQRKRVLLIYHPEIVYFDGRGGVFELTALPPNSDHEMWSRDLWCLFDAKSKSATHLDALPYNECCFVVSTPPKRSLINDFKKPPSPEVFYMPLWTKDEMQSLAPLFPNSQEWENRFRDLGGVPRFVLEDIREPPQILLQNACMQCDLDECTRIIGIDSNITDKNKIVHALVHIASTAPYRTPSVQYASEAALLTIARLKKIEARRHMQSLLESCEGIPSHVASLCGYIFEDYAIDMLQAGGTFVCRKLFDGRNKRPRSAHDCLIIPPSPQRITAAGIEAFQKPKQLYVPVGRNFTAIDAWIPGIGAFHMTVSREHAIRDDIPEKLNLLGSGKDVLYWLLPPLHFNTFTIKDPHDLKQYAVLIPYPGERI